jgi:hypothetical protein
MKFWMLVSLMRDEREVLREVLRQSRWARYAVWFNDFERIVREQDRSILDAELDAELCREALAACKIRYSIRDGVLRRLPDHADETEHEILTALQVLEAYGGEALEEVHEYGSHRVA